MPPRKKKTVRSKVTAALAFANAYPSGGDASFSRFVRSEFFTIILTDSVGDPPLPTTSSSITIRADQDEETSSQIGEETAEPFYIHRELLASLSPELFKHVYNDMSEGIEGVLKLKEVDEPTMERFLEWAYTKAYPVAEKSASALLPHIKVYVLAERFNVTALKDLAYSHFAALLCEIGLLAVKDDLTHVLAAARYAFENLPTGSLFSPPTASTSTSTTTGTSGTSSSSATDAKSEVDSSTTTTPKDKNILKYFAHYISWSLDALRAHPDFLSLLEDSSDFAKIVVCNSCPSTSPPWSPTPATTTTPTSHVLKRYCNSCGYTGVASPLCASCGRYDHEVGIEANVGGVKAILGEGRTSGTRDRPNYKCVWCNNQYEYSSNTGYNRRLYCRKCNSTSTSPATS